MPMNNFPGIVHGDYKIDNLYLYGDDPTRILGVLDWEMSTLGDTLADLGTLVSFWDEIGAFHTPITAGATAHEGFPSAQEVVKKYADRRGISIDDHEWSIVFADFKIAVLPQDRKSRG